MRGKLALSIALMLLFAACAKEAPRAAIRPEGARTAKAQALEAWLSAFASKTSTIKALIWFHLSDGEEERESEAALLLSRPASIRIDAMDALADVWAKAGTDGNRLWLYVPARDKLYSGRASRSNLHRLLKFDWEVPEIVSMIAGSPPAGDDPEFVQVGSPRDGHFVSMKSGLHVWTDPKSSRPVKCARYEPDGTTLDYMATFGGWKKIDGRDFPTQIEASFPGREAKIVVLYRDASFGNGVDAGAFLAPSRGKGGAVELKD